MVSMIPSHGSLYSQKQEIVNEYQDLIIGMSDSMWNYESRRYTQFCRNH